MKLVIVDHICNQIEIFDLTDEQYKKYQENYSYADNLAKEYGYDSDCCTIMVTENIVYNNKKLFN